MNTIKFESNKKVKMIAHRGLSGLERENTCPAFVAAAQRTYFGIETDVHITKDGKFILCHDSNLKRIAGVNMVIEETDFETLRAIRFTDIVDDMPRCDICLPTPEEYLHICKKYEKYAILEIKGTWEEEQLAKLAFVVQSAKMVEHTVFIAFSKLTCLRLKNLLPEAKIQFLSESDPEESADFCIEHGFDADFIHHIITRELVEKLHKAGLSVNCWTVNSAKRAEELQVCGVDYITTNILE